MTRMTPMRWLPSAFLALALGGCAEQPGKKKDDAKDAKDGKAKNGKAEKEDKAEDKAEKEDKAEDKAEKEDKADGKEAPVE